MRVGFGKAASHEFRSPLNAILGFAQLMSSDTPPPTPLQMASITYAQFKSDYDTLFQQGWRLYIL
jgi:signal transduction histidine kinase